jgi:hypothetical protein
LPVVAKKQQTLAIHKGQIHNRKAASTDGRLRVAPAAPSYAKRAGTNVLLRPFSATHNTCRVE